MTIFAIFFVLFISHFISTTSYTLLFEDLTVLSYFVDKTSMLRILFNESLAPDSGNPYYFITCPRYFGKTANLRMVQSFATFRYNEHGRQLKYDETDAYKIFKKLLISDHPHIISDHMARYPVLYLDLKTIGHLANESQHVVNDLTATFLECLYDHPKLMDLSQSNTSSSDHNFLNESDLKFLKTIQQDNITIDQAPDSLFQFCRILYEFYNQTQVVLLIDNYDDTAIHSFTRPGSNATPAYQLINSILSRAFDQGRKYLKVALITGISSLGYVIGDSLKQLVTHYPFLDDHQFTSYFGISQIELEGILNRAQYEKSNQKAIVDYYKGYLTFPAGFLIYNPYSIGNYFLQSEFSRTSPYPLKRYWANYEIMKSQEVFARCPSIRDLAVNRTIRYPLRKLHLENSLEELEKLRDDQFNMNITKSQEDILMTLYFEIGYLSHTSEPNTFVLPNQELRDDLLTRTVSYEPRIPL